MPKQPSHEHPQIASAGRRFLVGALPLILVSCGGSNADDGDNGGPDLPGSDGYDAAVLEEYRAALPSASQLQAEAPRGNGRAAGDAQFPAYARGAVESVNGLVTGMVTLLETIVSVPPTVYNSETREFLWGPWENDDGYGKVVVYIRENPPAEDFRYTYAFARLDGDDVATAVPVIWGAATPDPDHEERGVGLTLWDFEANHLFDSTYNDAFDPQALITRGRFVALYGRGAEEGGEYVFNVAMFRNFVPEDGSTGGQSVDLDYYYGRYFANEGHTLSFLDWQMDADVDENGTIDDLEQVGIRLAFLNDGLGRAEVAASGGDLGTAHMEAVECWDPLIQTTYFTADVIDGEATTNIATSGQSAYCGPIFENTLDTIGVPSWDDLDAQTLADMECVALNGLEGCGQT